jgi:hypothetical protein
MPKCNESLTPLISRTSDLYATWSDGCLSKHVMHAVHQIAAVYLIPLATLYVPTDTMT